MACSIEPHRGAQLGKVAHAECFAGASPCAPNSRAARGVRYHTTRGTTAGPNHYDACEGYPPAPVRAHIAHGGSPPRAVRIPPPPVVRSRGAVPWCGWHFVRVCGAMGTSRPTAYYPREIPPIPRPMVRSRCGRARCHRPWRLSTRAAVPPPVGAPNRGALHSIPQYSHAWCARALPVAAQWGHRALPHITPAKFPLSRIPWCGPVACALPLRSVARRAIENAKILCAPIHPAPSLFVLLCVKKTRTPPPNPASRPRRRAPWCGPVAVGRDVIDRGGSPLAPHRPVTGRTALVPLTPRPRKCSPVVRSRARFPLRVL